MEARLVNISNAEYHSETEHLSASKMKNALVSMRHFEKPEFKGRKGYFDLGTAFELYLIDKNTFFKEVHVYDERQRPNKNYTMASSDNKKWLDSLAAKHNLLIESSEFNMIKAMYAECQKNKTIMNLLQAGDYQISVFWTDEQGLKVKARPDIVIFIDEKTCIIIDIKTTVSAQPEEFSSQCKNLHYPFQAVMQIKAMEALGYFVDSYYWLAVEKSETVPMAQMYEFTVEDQVPLRIAYKSVSEKIMKYRQTGKATGYEDGCDNQYGILRLHLGDFYKNKMRNL